VPTVVLGLAVFLLLQDGIDEARWLSDAEKDALRTALREDAAQEQVAMPKRASIGEMLANVSVWKFGAIYFTIQMGVYAINFWLPSIIQSLGISSASAIGWLSAIPYLVTSVAMVVVGRSADARRERRWHVSLPMAVGVIGLVMAAQASGHFVGAMIGLTLATAGALTALAMFWPLPTAVLVGASAAGGVALINSLGQIAGFVSPYIIGWIKDATHRTDLALYLLSSTMVIGALLVMTTSAKEVNR
jgi:MFS-type transporter involved in bile tolerance (Atg22 family)